MKLLGPALLFWLVGAVYAQPVQPKSLDSPAFREFSQRVKEYVQLQKAVPRIKTTKNRKEIIAGRNALAAKIRETRTTAKPGDIFSPAGIEEFTKVIRSTLQGVKAPNVRKTIRQGEPQTGWKLTVNGDYPEHLPFTTIPPTLLMRLPQLPPEVAYRIIGHDFVLQDLEARVVVDFIAGALP